MFWDFGEEIFPVRALLEESMTAIARIHTPEGFVVAAEGRALGRAATIVDRDDMQKIVSLQHVTGVMSCAGSGIGMIGHATVAEHAKAVMLLVDPQPVNFSHYLEILGEKLHQRIQRSFSIPPPFTSRLMARTACLHLDGFFRGRPERGRIEISRDANNEVLIECRPEELVTGKTRVIGWEPVWSELPLERDAMNLDDAIRAARRIIGAHCSEAAERAHLGHADLPPVWPFGGHIHIATVTPDGFKWVVEPTPQKRDLWKSYISPL